jgi:hypothetical protein
LTCPRMAHYKKIACLSKFPRRTNLTALDYFGV